MDSSQILKLTELSLVGGPLDLPDYAVSFADDWQGVIYTPQEIANAILSVPGVNLLHDSSPSWNDWKAQWLCRDRTIDFDISAFSIDPQFGSRPGTGEYWGGSMFLTSCLLRDVLDVWRSIQRICPAVWLHDTECRMYNPRSFVTELPSKIAQWCRS
jgi:hypothetical protein